MKLTCDEATTICDKNQYGEASIWEKIRLSIHIIVCGKCGRYSKQNVILTRCYEKHSTTNREKECLKEEEKECMQQELENHI